MSKKMLFVYNPKAGKSQIKYKLADILDIFAKAGYDIRIVPTGKKGDAEQTIANITNRMEKEKVRAIKNGR